MDTFEKKASNRSILGKAIEWVEEYLNRQIPLGFAPLSRRFQMLNRNDYDWIS
jgi:hypothetical protein